MHWKVETKGGAVCAMAAVRCVFVRNAENVPRALKMSEMSTPQIHKSHKQIADSVWAAAAMNR